MAKSSPRFFYVLFLNDLSGLYNCVMISVEIAEPTAVSHLHGFCGSGAHSSKPTLFGGPKRLCKRCKHQQSPGAPSARSSSGRDSTLNG